MSTACLAWLAGVLFLGLPQCCLSDAQRDDPIACALRTTRAAVGPRLGGSDYERWGQRSAWRRLACLGPSARRAYLTRLAMSPATTPAGSLLPSVLPAASPIEVDRYFGPIARTVGLQRLCHFKVVVSSTAASSTPTFTASRCAAAQIHKPLHLASTPSQP